MARQRGSASRAQAAFRAQAASESQDESSGERVIPAYATLFLHVLVMSLHGALTQLMLSPTYGSLNATEHHSKIVFVGNMVGAFVMTFCPSYDSQVLRLRAWLPIIPFYFPVIQRLLLSSSNDLGPANGPVVNELVTLMPFYLLSSMYLCAYLTTNLSDFKDHRWYVIFMIPAVYFATGRVEARLLVWLPKLALYSQYLTKIWLSLGFSVLGLAQSNLAIAATALPALSHTLQRNPHLEWRPIRALPSVEKSGYSLIDRKESITGYISVLENNELAYRVLRCDHSLLGGEWLLTENAIAQGITGTEPVYAVFEMLEAVRLIETTNKKLDSEKKALVIGLGIGTAPKALLAHGIDTTIVELDPVVHEFATKYFDLPNNHTAYLEDAIGWTQDQVTKNAPQYDFILHDVFTGGAEPLALFTYQFITNLQKMLKPNGVIAINYAGSVNARPSKQVLNTINNVFEERCRMFRDLVPDGDNPDSDFVNMVIFCLHPADSSDREKPTFRKPVEADYLSSVSRRHQLLPKPENELIFPSADDMSTERITMLTEANVDSFSSQQSDNAKKHWKVMREVVVPKVWEQW
ncbi:hypothetical protein K461DRAFT_281729 [Myriangium duriaei CBS 260.36]|uniref:PABS domain-containing protein n=1 Tax=Myriangium duriaei CBS 260.36 TaxID=1168546 RepID=A0A9P4MDN2_9PEZI|nr:hypothetical protein K461DRAFT_281729 [Myriangium duriaei CBS 260.36]